MIRARFAKTEQDISGKAVIAMSQETGFSGSSVSDSSRTSGSGGPPTRRIWIGGERMSLTGEAKSDSPLYSDLRVPPAVVRDLIAPREPKDLFESAFHDFRARVHPLLHKGVLHPETTTTDLTKSAVNLIKYCNSLADFLSDRERFWFANANFPTISSLARAILPIVSNLSPADCRVLVEQLWKLGWYNQKLVEALLDRITAQGETKSPFENPEQCAVVAAAAGRGNIHQDGLFGLFDDAIVTAIQNRYRPNEILSRKYLADLSKLFEIAAQLKYKLPKTVAELSCNTGVRLRDGLIPDLVSLFVSIPQLAEQEALRADQPAGRMLRDILTLLSKNLLIKEGSNAEDIQSHEPYYKIIPPIAATLAELDAEGARAWLTLHFTWVRNFLRVFQDSAKLDGSFPLIRRGYHDLTKAIRAANLEEMFPRPNHQASSGP